MRECDSTGRGNAAPGKGEHLPLSNRPPLISDSLRFLCAQKQVKDLQRRLREAETVKQEDIKPVIRPTPEVIDLTQ